MVAVLVAVIAALALLPIIDALMDYPYGCLEQTSSQARAIYAGAKLLPALDPEGGVDSSALLDAAVRRIWSMQQARGGLAMWPGGSAESVFASIYAYDLLLDLSRADISVSPGRLKRLESRILSWARDRDQDSAIRCRALEALSRASLPIRALVEEMLAASTQQAALESAETWVRQPPAPEPSAKPEPSARRPKRERAMFDADEVRARLGILPAGESD